MKNFSEKNKLIYAIVSIIIIAGAIVYFTKGFNFDMKYAKKDQIILSNKTGFDTSKVQEISKDILVGKNVEVQEVEIFKNTVAISSNEITDEEKGKIVEKINQEYNLEISADNIEIQNIEHVRIKDIVKPYILPAILTYALTLLYFLVRYRKMGVAKVLSDGAELPIFVELAFFSIIAICRVPFGDITIAMAIGIYALIFTVIAAKFERQFDEFNESQKENKK